MQLSIKQWQYKALQKLDHWFLKLLWPRREAGDSGDEGLGASCPEVVTQGYGSS